MTVKELREFLSRLDDDLEVLEENKGELRRLKMEDIKMDRNLIMPSAYYLDDEPDPIEEGVLIFGAWA